MATEILTVGALRYRIFQSGAGTWRGYIRWGGERWASHRSTKTALVQSCKDHALKINQGYVATTISEEEAAQLFEANKILKPFGITVADAARYYSSVHSGLGKRISVLEASAEFKKRKEIARVSPRYLESINFTLRPFATKFGAKPIVELTTSQIEDWILDLKQSPRSQNNHRGILLTLFRWARSRGYLPKNLPVCVEEIPIAKAKEAPISIISPRRLSALVRLAKRHSDARPHALTCLLFGAHTGIRLAELSRLKWEAVNITAGHIAIGADIAKTASRRLVPINETFKAWLQVEKEKANGKGLVIPTIRVYSQMTELWPEKKKIVEGEEKIIRCGWPQNCLRHSFISYRLAEVQNVAQVALEAGNSPQKVFSNYRSIQLPDGRLITAELAAKWFSTTATIEPRKSVP